MPAHRSHDIGGQLTFQRVQAQNEFVAEYQGGGTFYASGGNHVRSQQDFRVSYKQIGRAWAFLLSDAVNYSPEGGGRNGLGFSQLGTGVSAGGNSFINLNSQLLPNQSITATNSPRVSNTILAEFQKTLGRRSALTFSGSYGILRFLEEGFIDGNTINSRAGYNYTPTARDTIGFLYGGNLFRFNGTAQENLSHTIHVSYGRQITGPFPADGSRTAGHDVRPILPNLGIGVRFVDPGRAENFEKAINGRTRARLVLSSPEMPAAVLPGPPLQRRKVCRTSSDCTTAPRKGLPSGCYPLDSFYAARPEAARLKEWKEALRG